MALDHKYDQMYKGDGTRKAFRELPLGRWPRNRIEAISHQSGNGSTVLDIGCGDGYLLFQMKSKFSTLLGMEYSNDRLQQAVVNLSDLDFRPYLGSAEDMSAIETASVDQIISADTIEHIPDVYAAAKEMYRVVRHGGQLIINTPNIAFVKKRLLLLAGRFPSTSQPNEGFGNDVLFDGGHLHYFTFRGLGILFELAGFRVVKKFGYGAFGKLHDVYPELLSGGAQITFVKPQ